MGYEIVRTFQPETNLSIVKIEKGAILEKEDRRYLQMKLRNTSKFVLKEVSIEIECFDREGMNLGKQIYTYSNLFIPSGEIWGTDVAILLEISETESVELFINENNICYIDVETKRKMGGGIKTGIPIVDEKKNGGFFLASIVFSIILGLLLSIPYVISTLVNIMSWNRNGYSVGYILLILPYLIVPIMEIAFLIALKKSYKHAALFNMISLVASTPILFTAIFSFPALLFSIIYIAPLLYQFYFVKKAKKK